MLPSTSSHTRQELRPAPNSSWTPADSVDPRNLVLKRALAELAARQGRALEVGAGTARFLRALCRANPLIEGHACDFARAGLRDAHRSAPGLLLTQANFTALPYRDASFDSVLVFDVLEHLPDPRAGIRELWRVLAPGGLLHALVPCEGQPLTLHWLMWKTDIGADLKVRRAGHVQRFTHRSLQRLLEQDGFRTRRMSYSMHPIGQIKDILMHYQEGPEFPGWLQRNLLYRGTSLALWALAYVESTLLQRVSLSAVALHVTAEKP